MRPNGCAKHHHSSNWFAVVLCVGLLSSCAPKSGQDSLHALLAETRWTEGRLSISDVADSCVSRIRIALPQYCRENASDMQVRDTIRRIASLETSLDDHNRALFNLARGAGGEVQIGLLERHIAVAPSAAVWNDLSVALLADAHDVYDWRTYESALVATDVALELDDDYAPALFNRALILEKLALNELAITAWEAYIARNENSYWTAEARSRQAQLSVARVEASAVSLIEVVGRWSTEDLIDKADTLASPLQRLLDSDTELYRLIVDDPASFCREPLDKWVLLGNLIVERYDDALLGDVIDWICHQPTNENKIGALANVATAIERYRKSETEAARAAAVSAQELLGHEDSALKNIAMLLQGMALYARDRYDESHSILSEVEGNSESYPLLRARIQRYLGSLEIRRRNNDAADRHFRQGIDLLSTGGDPEQLTRLHSLAAETLALTGRYDDAWREGLDALRGARQQRLSADALSGSCEFLALIAAQSGASHLQVHYAGCSIANLGADADPAYTTSAYAVRGQGYIGVGDYRAAKRDLDRALTAAQSIDDAIEREAMIRYVDLFAAVSDGPSSGTESTDRLVQSLSFFSERGHRGYEIAGSTALAHAYAYAGEDEQAEYYFDYTGELAIEAQRAAETATFALPIQRHYRHVANRRISARLDVGDEIGALRVLAETRLARTLSAQETRSLIHDVANATGENATLVLAWLDDEVAGWLIDRRGLVRHFRSSLVRGESIVARAAGTHSTPLPDGRTGALAALYTAIVEPIQSDLGEHQALQIIPDDLLFGVPFPALWNKNAARFLAEERAVSVAPELLVRSKGNTSGFRSVAVFASSAEGTGRPLHYVHEEADKIRQALEPASTVTVFEADQTTPNHFLTALGDYELLHFGGHGEIDVQSPLKSKLVLGNGVGGGAITITSEELYAHHAEGMPRLIVLAACDSAAYTDRLPNALAVVRPLLDLGAGAVIGSLRPIPDEHYLRMMTMFYAALAESRDAETALRAVHVQSAQADLAGRPGHWASIQLYRYL